MKCEGLLIDIFPNIYGSGRKEDSFRLSLSLGIVSERSIYGVTIRLVLGCYQVSIRLLRRMQADECKEDRSEIVYNLLLPKYFI